MACRPWYQPQVGHTTWGSFAEAQLGHRLRAGATSFQLEARRLRLFALLVFFLGTATAGSYSCATVRWDRSRIVAGAPDPVVGLQTAARTAPSWNAVAVAHDPLDPGWPPLRRSLLGIILPSLAVRRASGGGGLTVLRSVFVSFSVAVVIVGVAAFVVASGFEESTSPFTASVLVIALGLLALGLGRLLDKPLDCTSDETLANGYRQRFFLRLATSEAAALVGFVAVVLTGHPWLYLVGAAITAVGFTRAAPTAANLATDQEALQVNGCGRSLVAALEGWSPGAR